jgi:hypothetical protein
MIKGMIALSISPFLVVDDNIHITLKKTYETYERFVTELPLIVCMMKLNMVKSFT